MVLSSSHLLWLLCTTFPSFPNRVLVASSSTYTEVDSLFSVVSFFHTEVVPLHSAPFLLRFRPQAPAFSFCATLSCTGSLVPTPGPKRPLAPRGVGLSSIEFLLSSIFLHSQHLRRLVFVGNALSIQCLGIHESRCFSIPTPSPGVCRMFAPLDLCNALQ